MVTRYEALQAQEEGLKKAIAENTDQTLLAQLQAALERTQQQLNSMSTDEAAQPLYAYD